MILLLEGRLKLCICVCVCGGMCTRTRTCGDRTVVYVFLPFSPLVYIYAIIIECVIDKGHSQISFTTAESLGKAQERNKQST